MEAGTVFPNSKPDEHISSELPYKQTYLYTNIYYCHFLHSKELRQNLYSSLTFVLWWLLTPTLLPWYTPILKFQTTVCTDGHRYTELAGAGGKEEAQGTLSYEVSACLNVQTANEKHKSQMQCN
jgi:hypothetical protein